jgi:biopolymer transport protein ExbD
MNPVASPLRERLFHLRRPFPPRQRGVAGLLDVAPWIDVTLLALLFFIVMSATVKKPGLLVQLPEAIPTTGARYDAQVLTVPQPGIFFFADQRVSEPLLAERLAAVAREHPGQELVIEADGSVSHAALTGLYNIAVEAGWSRIVLATRLPGASPEGLP